MSIQKEIDTNRLVLKLLDEVEKHFKTQDIEISEHSFGALYNKIQQDIMKAEMKTAPQKDEIGSLSENDIIEKLKRNPQLLDIVQTFKEAE